MKNLNTCSIFKRGSGLAARLSAVLLGLAPAAMAQGGSAAQSPATQAYILVVRADQARDTGDLEGALKFYQTALQQYRDLSRLDPDWNPEIVQYRITQCANEIKAIQKKLRGPDPAEADADAAFLRAKYEMLVKENQYIRARLAELQDKPSEPDPALLEQLDTLREANRVLEDRLASLREKSVSEDDLLREKANVALLRDEIALLKTENLQLKERGAAPEQLQLAETRIAELNAGKARVESDLATAREQHREQARAALELDRQVVQLQARLTQSNQALQDALARDAQTPAKLNVLKDENLAMVKQLDKALADLEQARADLASGKGQLDEMSADMGRLLKVERDAASARNGYREREAELMQEMDILKQEKKQLAEALEARPGPDAGDNGKALAAARDEAARAREQLARQAETVTGLQQTVSDLRKQLKETAEQLEAAGSGQEKWTAKLREQEVVPLQKDNESLKEANRELLKQRDKLSGDLAVREEQAAAWSAERKEMQVELKGLESRLAVAAREMQKGMGLSGKLDEARTLADQQEKAAKAATDELQKALKGWEKERSALIKELETIRGKLPQPDAGTSP